MILTTVVGFPLTASATTDPFDGEWVPITVTTYAITVDSAIENGTVTSSAAKVSAGATVTLTVTPDDGYELDTLTVSDGTNEIETTAGEGGTYTFSMPAIAVTVTATFKATATTEPMVLYFQPNSNWKIDNARFAAYFYGNSGDTFADMTLAEGETDIYEVTVPEGYTNVIFLRMNGASTENSWDNKWNQTSEFTIPTDGTNFYTYASGGWDQGSGTWSTYGDSTEPEATNVASVDIDGTVTEHATFAEAVTAAQAASGTSVTLKLLDNVTTDSEIYITSGKFTLDLNGKTYTSSSFAFAIYGTADVIITDNTTEKAGKIVGTDSSYATVSLRGDAKLEFAGGTIEIQDGYAINTSDSGNKSNSQLTVSGGKLVTTGWAAINVYCNTVAVTGGTIESLGDDINYVSALLDFSAHTAPTGIHVWNASNAAVTPGDTTIKLPEGYCFYDSSDSAVTVLESGYTYTIGEAPEGEPEEPTEPTSVTVYFENTGNWTNVYIYGWNDSNTTGDNWPGSKMTDMGNGYWSYELPSETVNVIFNDGSGTQTPDIPLPTDGKNLYTYSTGEWSAYSNEVIIPTLDGKVTVIEGTITGFAPVEMVKVIGLEMSDGAVEAFLWVENNGLTYFQSYGAVRMLCDKDGNYLHFEDGVEYEFALVYNDITKTYRFAIDGEFAYCEDGSDVVLAVEIEHRDPFDNTDSVVSLAFHDSVTLTAAYNIGDSDTAEIVALQNHNEETSIRLLAGLDTLWYGAAGFKIEIYADGELVGSDTQQSTLVYESVEANGETVKASEKGHRYFSAYTINGVDVSDGRAYYLLVTPYTVIGDTITSSETVKIDIDTDGKASFAAEE